MLAGLAGVCQGARGNSWEGGLAAVDAGRAQMMTE